MIAVRLKACEGGNNAEKSTTYDLFISSVRYDQVPFAIALLGRRLVVSGWHCYTTICQLIPHPHSRPPASSLNQHHESRPG